MSTKHISKNFGYEFDDLLSFRKQDRGAKHGRAKYRKKLRRIVRKIDKRSVADIINSEL
jgi:septation ring formation regulator EzrA